MPLAARVLFAVVLAWLPLSHSPAWAQTSLEDAKRAYFEGRFEASIDALEPLLSTLSEEEALREAAFFLGLNHLALGSEERGRSYFQSAVRHDPDYQPSTDLFNPNAVGIYRDVRSALVGRLVVESTPPGARVVFGGRDLGTTPYQGVALEGDRILQLELDGYASEERPVYVRAGEDTDVSVSLRPTGAAESGGSTTSESGGAQTGGSGGVSGKTIGIIAGAGGGAAAALVAAGGGGNGTSGGGGSSFDQPTPANAVYMVSITPNPVQSQRSSDPDFDWLVQFTVNIVESAGLGGNVDFINVVLRDGGSGNETRPLNFGAGDIIGRAGTNRIEGNSRLEVPVGIVYNFPSGRSSGTATLDIQVTDDRGNRQRLSANVAVR